jgi:hypothetical protein
MLSAEYTCQPLTKVLAFNGSAPTTTYKDLRSFYGMAIYVVTNKLTAGIYYSSAIDRKVAVSAAKCQKDWALSTRYDLSPFVYVKAEEHILDGTPLGYSTSNKTSMRPNDKVTLLKLGGTFP